MPHPRFTPTPVGTSPATRGWSDQGSVHPHACGDLVTSNLSPALNTGSPPRLWGPRKAEPGPALKSRFTPTPVGTSHATGVTKLA